MRRSRAARRIWDSAATPQARAYRERLGLAGDGGMAVVVMPLIEARVSGIAFTRDPVGGRHDEMLIHANWGLGEALVSGQAEGDEYRLREDATTLSWRLAASRIGAKRQASRLAGRRPGHRPAAHAGRRGERRHADAGPGRSAGRDRPGRGPRAGLLGARP
ncbi:PEP/pyruvate-binding domain-containing protein [Achromobacter xylosoxidans]